MTWAADFKTAALAPMLATFGVSVTIRDPNTDTAYVRNAMLWRLEGFPADGFRETKWIVHNDATLGVTSPENGWTITYEGVIYPIQKVTSRGNGVAWELWTRDPEQVT